MPHSSVIGTLIPGLKGSGNDAPSGAADGVDSMRMQALSIQRSRIYEAFLAAPGALGLSFLLLFGAPLTVEAQQAKPVATGTPVAAGQAAPPQCDANCVRANATRAAEACAPRIEAEAPTDFDWITRPTSSIFQQADPSSPSDAVVRYRGDSIRFMQADKNWLRVSYECAFDVNSHAVVFVHVRSGRLDQPLGATVARPPEAAAKTAVPAAATPTAAATPMMAPPKKPRPHVGEPSRVEIQQQNPNPKPPST
jgi:hypothetical protein